MLCLANSYKHGGRCLAGIEVTFNDNEYTIVRDTNGVPKWVRPISRLLAGQVPNAHACNIRVLSIVRIVGVEYAGSYSHSEDVYYQSLSVHSYINPTRVALNNCLDNYHLKIFGNRGKALTPECFQNGNYSVMLIRTENPEVYIDTRFDNPKPRMKFVHNGNNYDFPITDPVYLDRIKSDDNCIGTLTEAYLVLSLGVEHEGWHSKLIAAIIVPQEDGVQQVTAQPHAYNQNISQKATIKQDGIVYRTNTNKTNAIVVPQAIRDTQKNVEINSETADEQQKTAFMKQNRLENDYNSKHIKELNTKLLESHEIEPIHTFPDYSSKPKQKVEGCYIATAVYGSYDADEVLVLREFRDTVLKKSFLGKLFINTYYAISPYIANKMKRHKHVNQLVKHLLDKFVSHIKNANTKSL